MQGFWAVSPKNLARSDEALRRFIGNTHCSNAWIRSKGLRMALLIELCGCCRTNKPQSGLFSRHYYTLPAYTPAENQSSPFLKNKSNITRKSLRRNDFRVCIFVIPHGMQKASSVERAAGILIPAMWVFSWFFKLQQKNRRSLVCEKIKKSLETLGFQGFGGDYWTRTSDLLRVKKYGDFCAGNCNHSSAWAAAVSWATNG